MIFLQGLFALAFWVSLAIGFLLIQDAARLFIG